MPSCSPQSSGSTITPTEIKIASDEVFINSVLRKPWSRCSCSACLHSASIPLSVSWSLSFSLSRERERRHRRLIVFLNATGFGTFKGDNAPTLSPRDQNGPVLRRWLPTPATVPPFIAFPDEHLLGCVLFLSVRFPPQRSTPGRGGTVAITGSSQSAPPVLLSRSEARWPLTPRSPCSSDGWALNERPRWPQCTTAFLKTGLI